MTNTTTQTGQVAAILAISVPDVLDAGDVARWLRCSRPTAIRHLRSGRIRAKKVGGRWLVLRAEFLAALRPDAPPPPLRLVAPEPVR